jgi:hypothetical protein
MLTKPSIQWVPMTQHLVHGTDHSTLEVPRSKMIGILMTPVCLQSMDKDNASFLPLRNRSYSLLSHQNIYNINKF